MRAPLGADGTGPNGYIESTAKYHPISTTENCIATRGDLNPVDGDWCIGSFAHRNHVGSDAKISSFSQWTPMVPATIVSGPTWGAQSGAGDLPVFCWSNASLTPAQKNASTHQGQYLPQAKYVALCCPHVTSMHTHTHTLSLSLSRARAHTQIHTHTHTNSSNNNHHMGEKWVLSRICG